MRISDWSSDVCSSDLRDADSDRRSARRFHLENPPSIDYVRALLMATQLPLPPKVGMVSLGCPKNLVDSERILTKLRSDGYQMSPDYAGADVVLVNTCVFLDSEKDDTLEPNGEAMSANGPDKTEKD